MTPDQLKDTNARLIRCARTSMAAWAARWKVVRNDPKEAESASRSLENAKLLRDMAKRWEENG